MTSTDISICKAYLLTDKKTVTDVAYDMGAETTVKNLKIPLFDSKGETGAGSVTANWDYISQDEADIFRAPFSFTCVDDSGSSYIYRISVKTVTDTDGQEYTEIWKSVNGGTPERVGKVSMDYWGELAFRAAIRYNQISYHAATKTHTISMRLNAVRVDNKNNAMLIGTYDNTVIKDKEESMYQTTYNIKVEEVKA